MSILSKFFGNANQRYLKSLKPLIERINILELEFEGLSDQNLRQRAGRLKERLKNKEILDDILPEAFALVRESAKRTLAQRHFDVQLIGGIALHQGKIAQMLTGEGKTLAATLPVFLNALEGKGAHIVTVNDYLARRDTVWMGQIYHVLGLSVGCIVHDAAYLYDPAYQEEAQNSDMPQQAGNSKPRLKDGERDEERDLVGGFRVVESYLKPVPRKEAYGADITYGTNNEFGFDYLRGNLVHSLSAQVQRGFHYAILDEVDSILIDEARTPLIISAPDTKAAEMYKEFALIIPHLKEEIDYEIDEKMKVVTLTEAGVEKVEKVLGMENIYDEKGIKYLHHLEQALRAQATDSSGRALFERDRAYVVKNGQVIIVDEFTGRLMPGRRWSGGLHQAIEAKEGVEVQPESITLATVTFQNYFRMYEKLAGMTGTAVSSAEELDRVYGLDVIVVPTHKPMIRKDMPDRVYKTEAGKFKAIVEEIKRRHKKGQPVLVGTRSIEKNEYLGRMLEREGISHQILNAKQHEKEGQIIAQAGRLGQVTVATNMAGRGVDIVLGGNPPDPIETKKIKELGGLHVIGTERHEARRIDNQLRGRSGRQGDPGSGQFFVSLEDDLMRIFGGEKIKSLMERLKLPDSQPIEASLVSGAIESAQKRIEGFHFDARSHLLEFDDVINKHRETIYKKRREILKASPAELQEKILEIIQKQGASKKEYLEKEKEIGQENMRKVERAIWLRNLDWFWMNHLENMEHLRDSVRLRTYARLNPLVEYKNEGHRMFKDLLETIESNVLRMIFKLTLQPASAVPSIVTTGARLDVRRPTGGKESLVGVRKKKVGRNEPCPCGRINPKTGKPMKYKKCCWPKFG